MASVPDLHFTRNGEVRLAWSQWGSGPDILVVPGLFSNLEVMWEHEITRRVNEFMGEHCRQTIFDKRGMGLSDRSVRPPTLDEFAGDICSVMDAAGLESVALLGISEGGVMCQTFAALHPERVDRLVLANSVAGARIHDEFTDPARDAEMTTFWKRMLATWGEDAAVMLGRFAPTQLSNPSFMRWVARYQRQSGTALDVLEHLRNTGTADAYDLLADISAPTVVMNTSGDAIIPPGTGDRLAELIPGARRLLIEGGDHFFWWGEDWVEIVTAVLENLTDETVRRPSRREFGTVVFTDIVGSTSSTVEQGDAGWRDRLDAHDRIAWNGSDRHGGVIVKSTGDGLLARFALPTDALAFAIDLRNQLLDIDLPIRVGLHTGEIEIRHNNDITGIAVNLAARVEQAADDGAIFVSSTVRDMMLGGSVHFRDRGEHELKGIDGRWRLYEVASTTG